MTGLIKKFWAPWCQPCKQIEPIIEKLEKEYKVEKINVDEELDIAQKYGVMSLPTVIIFDDDKEIARYTGMIDYNKIVAAISEYKNKR